MRIGRGGEWVVQGVENTVLSEKCRSLLLLIICEHLQMSEKIRYDEKDLRVLNRKMVYCIGIPCTMSDEEIESEGYFGKYGTIKKIVVMNGNRYQNTTSVYITYSTEVEAAMAILATNGETIGRNTLKTIFGTVKYCHYFLKKIACKNLPDCPYLHVYDKKNEVYIKDSVFEVYHEHQQAAKAILLANPSCRAQWQLQEDQQNDEQDGLPQPSAVISKIFPDTTEQINSKIVKMLLKQCQKSSTSKYLKDKRAKQDKTAKCQLYESLCKQYPTQVVVKGSE